LFVDGRGYAGKVTQLTPPKLALKTEEFRAGGMDAPVDVEMGMEKLEASFILTKYDPAVLKLFGVADGSAVALIFKAASREDDGVVTPISIEMRGLLKDIDSGSWKPGEKAETTYNISCNYYKNTVGGEVIHEIDVKNMKRIINGVDQLADIRSALGM